MVCCVVQNNLTSGRNETITQGHRQERKTLFVNQTLEPQELFCIGELFVLQSNRQGEFGLMF